MKLYKYLIEENDITSNIIDFFKGNPKPNDENVHKLANDLGIDEHKFEEIIYELLGAFFGAGKSKNFKGEYNKDELEKGIEIEMEHTTSPVIAERIAKDHLAEIPDYYTRLIKMEKEAGIKD
jgi:hypothetical protein